MSAEEGVGRKEEGLLETIGGGRESFSSVKKRKSKATDDESIIVTIDSTPKKKKFSLLKRPRDSIVTAGSDQAEEITDTVGPQRKKTGANFLLRGGILVYAQPFWLHDEVNVKKFDKMLRRVELATHVRYFYPYETVLRPNLEFPVAGFNAYCKDKYSNFGERRRRDRQYYEWCFEGLPPNLMEANPLDLSKVYTEQLGPGRNAETTIRYDPDTNYVEVSLSCEVTLEVKGNFGVFPFDKHAVQFAYNLRETHVAFEDAPNLAIEAQGTDRWGQADDTDYLVHAWFCDEIRVRDHDLDAYNGYFPTSVDESVARLFKLAKSAPEFIDNYFISLRYTLFRTGQSPALKLALENSGNYYLMVSILPVFAIVFVLLMSTHQSFVISSQSRAELYVLPFFGVIAIYGVKSLVAMECNFQLPVYHYGEIHLLLSAVVLVFSPIITGQLPQLSSDNEAPYLGFAWLGIHVFGVLLLLCRQEVGSHRS